MCVYSGAMNPQPYLAALSVLTLLGGRAMASSDQFTPVIASALTADARPFEGADGRLHLVYELLLTNANATPATLTKIEVVDGAQPSTVLATFGAGDLVRRLRTTGSGAVETATIEFNGSRLFLVDFTLDPGSNLPARLLHHIDLLGGATPGRRPGTPAALSYTVAPIGILRRLPEIGPPLRGNGWIAVNGCCGEGGAHRSTSMTVNGGLYYAQRFAIDWVRLDGTGRIVHGDPSDVRNYVGYGADILAVADGTVVDVLNNLSDQAPGSMPDQNAITIDNVDGNHVVLDLGDGVFAFYGHMQKGSVEVAVGDRVRRGQVLGKLGNTGNTSAPHLHFHLMQDRSVLGSNGIPYVYSQIDLAGEVSPAQFAAASELSGIWSKGLFRTPSPRHREFPLDLNIINFPEGR